MSPNNIPKDVDAIGMAFEKLGDDTKRAATLMMLMLAFFIRDDGGEGIDARIDDFSNHVKAMVKEFHKDREKEKFKIILPEGHA